MDELTDLLKPGAAFLLVVTLLVVGVYNRVDLSSIDGFISFVVFVVLAVIVVGLVDGFTS
jgi:FtsH-binding integral membrane protein